MSGPKEARCRGCGAEIYFVTTTGGAEMPCDRRRATVVTSDGRVVQGYPPHWGTCPQQKNFRRPPRSTAKKDDKDLEKTAQETFAALRQELGEDDTEE